jgi:hypothetical protein
MIAQFVIVVTGVISIWLTQQRREEWKRYACLVGLSGQPFWFYTSYQGEQWGIFILTIFYTYTWLLGYSIHWRS